MGAAALLALFAATACPIAAGAAPAPRTLQYGGLRIVVPAGWPVFNLANAPGTCVRFNRHAVYLGTPGARQRCPVHSIGRTEAILLEPAGATTPLPPAAIPGARQSEVVLRDRGALVTATWRNDPRTIEHMLGLRSLHPSTARPTPPSQPRVRGRAAGAGAVYTGPGFDACTAPSTSQMSSWLSSRYRAVGIYIGGANMGCSQPELSSGWVSAESRAGWHLIATYVGLQAPQNSCGCAPIDPHQATSEGDAAASDAVAQAQALGIGPGNPIYLDMEAYSTGGTNTSAVLTFVAAWTRQLHAEGYKSGVYSSAASGIVDLVSRYGTGYPEPDEIWFADWNGNQTTSTGYIPDGFWASHQRIHQYDGDHNETHGGVTLDIDGDAVDGMTAAAGTGSVSASAPASRARPRVSGIPDQGHTLSATSGSWSGTTPITYSYQWQRCGGQGCSNIPGATLSTYTLTGRDTAMTIRVVISATNQAGSAQANSNQLGPVIVNGGYWLYTAAGNIYNSAQDFWYSSPAAQKLQISLTAMAATTDRKGYWALTSTGQVLPYGDAGSFPPPAHRHPLKGIVAGPGGGYWLYTASGNIYATSAGLFHGSPVSRRITTSTVAGMAATHDRRGYWVVTSAGRVYNFGDARSFPALSHHHPIAGIVPAGGGGYWLYTATGNIYASTGVTWYGSPFHQGFRGSSITGMAATRDGRGYWLVTSSGRVYAFGDAAPLASPAQALPIAGIAT